MDKPLDSLLTHQIAKLYRVGYVVTNKDLTVLVVNALISEWSRTAPSDLVGTYLIDLFPELVGAEAILKEVAHGMRESFVIPQIQRMGFDFAEAEFYDLQIEPLAGLVDRLLVTIVDVTAVTKQMRRFQQQRNELGILSEQLAEAREKLAYLLNRFVPEPVVQQLITARNLPALGGTGRYETTVLFVDMRGFTSVAEKYAPEQTIDILNSYMDIIGEVIRQHEGMIVQIVGDLVMASFNVPDAQPDHADRAVQTAVDIAARLKRFVEEDKPATIPALGFGTGICTGPVTAGYLGTLQRYRYALVGDTTNVAYHLCAQARAGQIIIAQQTVDCLQGNFRYAPLGTVFLKRRTTAVAIYEILV